MKVLPYTDPQTSAHFEASAWLPMVVGIDHHALTAQITFLGFASVVAANQGRVPIGSRNYTLTGSEYLGMALGQVAPSSLLDAISEACYQIAEDDPFFADAVDVEYTPQPQ